MRKITDFIVNKRKIILIIFILLAILSAYTSTKVNINSDLTRYLPDTSKTKIGVDIMNEVFDVDNETSSLLLMFSGLEETQKGKIKQELENMEYIEEVKYEPESEEYNKDGYTLYKITIDKPLDSEETTLVYNTINKKYDGYEFYMDGEVADNNTEILPAWIVILAVLCALIILIIMCPSYVEPFLFLFVILLAVLLNSGTNIMFDNVSNITSSIAAILQMALSMDYSIMLMDRYNQEKEKEKDTLKAMKNALYNSFKSISSSSVTTIVGLLMLVFMSFTIGRDLGFVLAKGVLLSLVCIFTCLPGLILMFDKQIEKTRKKTPNIKLDRLGKISYQIRYIGVFLFVFIFVGSFLLKGNLNYEFAEADENKIAEVFSEDNQIAIVYENKYEDLISNYCQELENNENVTEVLGYGNTINEELKYDELNEKLDSLGSTTEIEDYLLKIIYYNYYQGSQENTMTFNEFVTFIQDKIYNNPEMADKIDTDMKSDIDRLAKFTTTESINQKRTAKDIANIFEIDKSDVDNLGIYYNSKNIKNTLTLKEFINFMNKDVLTSPTYSSSIDTSTKASLQTLSQFTNTDVINKKMTAKEISNLFGIDESLTSQLFTYYASINQTDIKLMIKEFSNFLINDVATNDNYSDMLDSNTLNQVQLLAKLSNKSTINTKMTASELSSLFGIDENTVNSLILLNYLNIDNGSKMTVPEFILTVKNLKENTNYLDNVDVNSLLQLETFAKNTNNINNTKMNKQGLIQIFNGLNPNFVDTVYVTLNLDENTVASPLEFINLTIDNLSEHLDNNLLNSLKLIKMVMEDETRYTSTEMAKILNISSSNTNQIYALNDYINKNTSNWKMTPYNLVNLILNNTSNKNIAENLNDEMLQQLNLAKTVMDSSKNNTKYSYTEMANIIGIDEVSAKNIYGLYSSQKSTVKISPVDFVKFILNHKNDAMLSGKIDSATIGSLNLVNQVMTGTNNQTKYTHEQLSEILGIEDSSLRILYSLYSSIYIDSNFNISLKDFTEFILNDVINNETYGSSFDDKSIETLKTMNGIMNSTINNTKYTANEIYAIFAKLTDGLDSNLVELVYLYYGSEYNYHPDWTLTVEKFVNYLNDDILTDVRFDDFIDDDMKNMIVDSKETVDEAKKLLVSDKYSRLIINTTFDVEGEDVFEFIKNLEENLVKNQDGIYIVGNSSMPYEMHQTFDDELNKITILTMIAIFIVVAITFKSPITAIILVLMIQCAVFFTMGVLSVTGGNVYFISILIVQSILMGATIDYAIVYTSYYLEFREKMEIKEAMMKAYNGSINTILTSASILMIVTFIIGNMTEGATSMICKTLCLGTFCSFILILLILPAVLAAFDRIVCKRNKTYKTIKHS